MWTPARVIYTQDALRISHTRLIGHPKKFVGVTSQTPTTKEPMSTEEFLALPEATPSEDPESWAGYRWPAKASSIPLSIDAHAPVLLCHGLRVACLYVALVIQRSCHLKCLNHRKHLPTLLPPALSHGRQRFARNYRVVRGRPIIFCARS